MFLDLGPHDNVDPADHLVIPSVSLVGTIYPAFRAVCKKKQWKPGICQRVDREGMHASTMLAKGPTTDGVGANY